MELYYYLILLSSNKYYVTLSELSDYNIHDAYGNNAPMESVCDWLLINKPVRILKKIKYNGTNSLNDHVILFMKEYGIANVRGGSYINVALTLEEKRCIHDTTSRISNKQLPREKEVVTKNCLSWFYSLFKCRSE